MGHNGIKMLPPGFYPFWFWNDRLERDEIAWQVAQMATQGVKGFFIHPRQGLRQPYLSEAYFQMVDVALAAAQAHQLIVHLYDEYPYPSGVAGGQVVLGQPQFQATQLIQQTHQLAGGSVRLELPAGKLLCCTAFPLRDSVPDWEHGLDLRDEVGTVLTADSYRETGLTAYNQKRYFASRPRPVLETSLPLRPHRLLLAVQATVHHHKYWGHFADVLNPQAVAHFIRLTHQRYRLRYSHLFGRLIASIFVDETEPAWSARIPPAFQETYGYSLIEQLPALIDPQHPGHQAVAYDLYRLKYRLFCEAFEAPLAAWCRAEGLAYSGEKPSLRLSQLRYMDIPGCEPGHTKVGAPLDLVQSRLRGNAKATASAAYFYGKVGSLCECYHGTGWSATLQDAKFIAEALLLLGITYLVPHGFFYTTHGLKKHDAPPSFFFQMPFWPLFGHLSQRINEIGRLFAGTYLDAQILLLDPNSGLPSAADLSTYEALMWWLLRNHLDFHIVDTDILQDGRLEEGNLRLADLSAKLLILPPPTDPEAPLQSSLAQFEAGGGRLFRCPPDFVPADLAAALSDLVRPSLSLQVEGRECPEILSVKRVGPDGPLWFLLNSGDRPQQLHLQGQASLRQLPLAQADISRLVAAPGSGFRLTIAPYESVMLSAGEPAPLPPSLPIISLPVGGEAQVQPASANLWRIAEWQMQLLAEDGRPGDSRPVPAVPLADQLHQAGFSFAPRFRHFFGSSPELDFPELQVTYRVAFENDYEGLVQLLMEPGSIGGEWRLWLNDSGPHLANAWRPVDDHVRGSLALEIAPFLRPGRNEIRLEVISDRPDGGLRNPLYLAGDFGLELKPLRLVARPTTGRFEDYHHNLLPYYAGVIDYTTRFELDSLPLSGEVILQFEYERPFHQASEVSVNGTPYQPLLWQPRQIRLATEQLIQGENWLRTRVYTTLIRSFEGQWFDDERHLYREVTEPAFPT